MAYFSPCLGLLNKLKVTFVSKLREETPEISPKLIEISQKSSTKTYLVENPLQYYVVVGKKVRLTLTGTTKSYML